MKLVFPWRLYHSVARFYSFLFVKMSSFEEVVNIQLVREVEKHPLLYNYKLPDYSKRELIEAAWNEIAEVMTDEPTNCKEKWRNLRTVFVRKLKPLPNGVLKRKSYYLSDAMSFLTPFIKLQKSDDTTESVSSPVQSESENVTCFEPEPDHNEAEDSHSNGYSNPSSYPQARRTAKKRIPQSQRFTEGPSEYVELKRSRYSEPDDSRKYFLLSILPEVQRLTDNQMKFFRRKLLDALDDAEAYPSEGGRPAGFFNEANTVHAPTGDEYFRAFTPKKEC